MTTATVLCADLTSYEEGLAEIEALPVVWLRAGTWASAQSWNARDGHAEPGLSVWRAYRDVDGYYIDARGLDVTSTMFIAFDGGREIVEVDCMGEVEIVGKGSDGEPLLRAVRDDEPLFAVPVEHDAVVILTK